MLEFLGPDLRSQIQLKMLFLCLQELEMKIDSAKSQQSTNVENTDSVVAMSEVRVLSL